MSDVTKYDGISALDQNGMAVEPVRARSDEGLKERERRGDFPNTQGPLGGEQRMVLEPLDDRQADALQDDETLYDELAAHEKERKPVNTVQTWEETGKSDLPVDQSSTAKD
jgi:hypothetical protein